MSRPPRSILDPAFRYTSAAKTSLAVTFARIRRENRALAESTRVKVTPMKRAERKP